MTWAPDGEEQDRDQRTLDVIYWLLPVSAGVAVGLPLLFILASVLGVDGESLFTTVVVVLPAVATVVLGVRGALRADRGDSGR